MNVWPKSFHAKHLPKANLFLFSLFVMPEKRVPKVSKNDKKTSWGVVFVFF